MIVVATPCRNHLPLDVLDVGFAVGLNVGPSAVDFNVHPSAVGLQRLPCDVEADAAVCGASTLSGATVTTAGAHDIEANASVRATSTLRAARR